MKALRNAPHPKGTGKFPPKVNRKELFPNPKPGTGFDMTKKGGRSKENKENKDTSATSGDQ